MSEKAPRQEPDMPPGAEPKSGNGEEVGLQPHELATRGLGRVAPAALRATKAVRTVDLKTEEGEEQLL